MKKTPPILMLYCLLFAISLSGCNLQNAAEQIGQKIRAEQEIAAEESPGNQTEKLPGELAADGQEWNDAEEEAGEPTENGPTDELQTPSTSTGRYVYTTLDGMGQLVYEEVYQAILSHAKAVRVSTYDIAVLDEAFQAVLADHGELFWVSGYAYTQYTMGETLIGIDFSPSYTMTKEEREILQGQIDAKAAAILAGVPDDASDYQKVRYVFDYLASNVEYVMNAENNQNIISVFLNGQTVCQGYACATQYLLTRLGIQSAIVTGEADGAAHAWNLVRMDGEYYYIDTTWGNSNYASEGQGEERFINYNYFGVTTGEISVTHRADDTFVLPDCTAQADNYYVRENRYFSEWNPDAVGALCKEGYEAGNATVSVKFSSEELYQQNRQYFIEEQHITDYCAGITSLYYLEDRQQRVLTFRFL